ncbi:MAG: hypothetical protein IPN82_03430 [Chitinophagaceae bacterium]|nr:hypothetical protein [Chitinophagaceae bacterium]MBP6477298.1 hypothetical protein [Chitinophagaceae bacterium]MBP7108912.1 hypothetical protein [Chitinophagaceae bacterium]MBP7314276.1 hypothetical protein [Chitinophagaceae bacterium]
MGKIESKFIGIKNSNELVVRENLNEVISFPYLEKFYFEKRFHHDAENQYKNGRVNFYHYIPIDKSGERIKINVGNFELIEISPEVNYYHKFLHREVNIFDKQNNIIRTYKSFTNNEQFIINDVLFIIESLKKVPDWDIFLKLSNIPNLEKQISKMEVEIDKLKMKIAELKNGSD